MDTLLQSVGMIERIFGYKEKALILYDTEREELKNFLVNLGYDDVYTLFPERLDEEKVFRTLGHLFSYYERPTNAIAVNPTK